MSDFLQSLRNNSLDKKFNNRRKYSGSQQNQYTPSDKRANEDRRIKSAKSKDTLAVMDAIRMLLEDISENQQELLFTEEKKASIEEKKLQSLENIASFLEKIATNPNPGFAFDRSAGSASQLSSITPPMETIRKPGPSDRETIMEIITKMRNEGATFNMIAQFLDKEDFPTFSGKGAWHAQTVHRLCQQMDAKEAQEAEKADNQNQI